MKKSVQLLIFADTAMVVCPMRKISAAFLFLYCVLTVSCNGKEPLAQDDGMILGIPSSVVDALPGMEVSVNFFDGQGPDLRDKVVLVRDDAELVCDILFIGDFNFIFLLPQGIVDGDYVFCIRHDGRTREYGTVSIVLDESSELGIDLEMGTTVCGRVHCGGRGLPDVQVTDGYEVVLTDGDGIYRMTSQKRNGLVWISTPSGYTAPCVGVQAKFYQYLEKAPEKVERHDFELLPDGDQTSHTMLFLGDMHLAARTNDRNQFATFAKEIEQYAVSHASERVYAMTLGDMTWDLYWYSSNYSFSNYLADINSHVRSFTVYHTMGNHDHDMRTSVDGTAAGWDAVDWDTANAFRRVLGPNYYSFNIGMVHYIVLDNIYCKNTTGGKSGDRKYAETVCSDDLEWLRKDLSHVSHDTPVVVTMHASLYNQSGKDATTNASVLTSCFSGFSDVTFVTGHSHRMWTVDSDSLNLREYNSGAVCAAWWWSGYYYPTLNVSTDGAPAGYRIMDVKGTVMTSRFKGTGRDDNYQFRSYDRNEIDLSGLISSSVNASAFDAYATKYGGYNVAVKDNQVLINVWDWNQDWKIEVTENGTSLEVSRVNSYDPLYFLTYLEPRFRATSDPTFDVCKTNHLFLVRAGSADSTLEVRVTDDEGRVYTESMHRPKSFSIDTYR